MSAVLWPVAGHIVADLNTVNGTGEHETAMRLIKVVEEAGEASAAYIGMTGQNPRKGTTHTRTDVADELCDVIIAAAVALHSFTATPPAVLEAKLNAAARRLTAHPAALTRAGLPELTAADPDRNW
ncbi:MazG-like family protein [Streptomyces sp. H39-S7]|uniref:MazG-like family protein n=1 Tax=Streptomyces sp. H39-S7 TaxID=3004357 RepID=UPI0022AFA0E9|nr:MazG-like family protein [Streptomyces sp. H39-S7]MCZ4125782.1 MazG-like family protein [Streptomyces sp. H39-S7]